MAGFALNRSRQAAAEDTPAFGGIAERFRRAGDLDRAIALCREGLKKFPNQLSARVTLGWSLLDQGKFDQAQAELEQVLRRAPDNLAAIRGLAELHERTENSVNHS
jgi:tetratricopeptide (TPR) repeat protein